MTPHLDDGRIAELLDGEIPSPELAAIRAHLTACPDCAAKLASAQSEMTAADELITLLDEPAPEAQVIPIGSRRPATRRDWLRRAAWAASLVVAAGAGYLSRGADLAPPSREAALSSPADERSDSVTGTAVPVAGSPQTTNAIRNAAAATREIAPSTPPPPAAPVAESGVVAGERAPSPAREVAAQTDLARDADERFAAPRQRENALAAGRRVEPPPRDQVTSKQTLIPDTIDLAEAVERLGGSVRLIDGRYPVRIETLGDEVHVVYGSIGGEVRLAQRRLEDRISWRLVVPAGFPADSLAAIRRRVDE